MRDLLLITPPFTQLNTPYPATAYLKGFLNTIDISADQMDLGMEVILRIFSADGLANLFDTARQNTSSRSENAGRILSLRSRYEQTIDPVIAFLQGRNQTLARSICTGNFLPEASRFKQLQEMEWAFGAMGLQDKAKHIATLYLEDLSDFIVECIDPHFGFSRYAERLGRSAHTFDELHGSLQAPPTYIDEITQRILSERIRHIQPKLICFSVPFPGNLYSAFRCAAVIRRDFPHIRLAMGGGFANTELRSLKDVRVFSYFHYITLDRGERPLELIARRVLGQKDQPEFLRTYELQQGAVAYHNDPRQKDHPQTDVGYPDYSGLPMDRYISVIEVANPMHSLWTDGKWLKLTMAHGCYWAKCTFCDVSLDYIANYEPVAAKLLVDRMEKMMEETGETGFHFVDEAAPPALMKSLALEIIRRNITVSWWTNIRFEKRFTPSLCRLLAASGCIAVSGGLEVASDRLLALIDKGVTVPQVARVTRNFAECGIMVHAYLMYGYPTQTVQETIDSLEMVRQLFEAGVIQSGFWHQFALTAHSPIGLDPSSYNISPIREEISFADNDVAFTDATGIDHEAFSFGLRKSLYNYMHDVGFDLSLQEWFDFEIPDTTVHPDYIQTCLEEEEDMADRPQSMLVWLGALPQMTVVAKKKRGEEYRIGTLNILDNAREFTVQLPADQAEWLLSIIPKLMIRGGQKTTLAAFKMEYEQSLEHFDLFWEARPMRMLKNSVLLLL